MTEKKPLYCEKCGAELTVKEHPTDGPVAWCPQCEDYRYPGFNTAVSMIVFDAEKENILLLDQYGKDGILVAGYVAQGESLETAVRREVREETGLEVEDLLFNTSRYYEGTNTLMCNFACAAAPGSVIIDPVEVDRAVWVPIPEVKDRMRPNSLAKWFTMKYLEKSGRIPPKTE